MLGADGFPVAELPAFAVLPGYSERFGLQHWAGDIGRSYIERDEETIRANARLIAEALAMRDSLAKLRLSLREWQLMYDPDHRDTVTANALDEADAIFKRLRGA